MKLKNKKTGEIGTPRIAYQEIYIDTEDKMTYCYKSLQEVFEAWEEYEEQKEYWYIDPEGTIICEPDDEAPYDNYRKQIGNYFETKEEAEKAVKKLKAWKRLKDNGLTFCDWKITNDECSVDVETTLDAEIVRAQQKYITDDLDLLFGGEE